MKRKLFLKLLAVNLICSITTTNTFADSESVITEIVQEKSNIEKKITRNFEDVDLRKAISQIADMAEINVIVNDSVIVKTSLTFDNAPWQQALETICKNHNLSMHKVGDILLIAPINDVIKQKNNIQNATPVIADNNKPKLKKYTGKPITLDFAGIELRNILQVLADITDLKLAVSDSVKGKITLRLYNTPWDQVLDVILHHNDLDMHKVGNIIIVAPADDVIKQKHNIRNITPVLADAQRQPLKKYTGTPISIDFGNTNIVTVLSVISASAGLELVLEESITDAITIRLKNVPWDQALDIVLHNQNLVMKRRDKTLIISKKDTK